VLGRGFRFVESLQGPVHPFVEAPVSVDGDPVLVQRFLDVEQRLDGALEDGCESDVESENQKPDSLRVNSTIRQTMFCECKAYLLQNNITN
jgi:hypothetical protein